MITLKELRWSNAFSYGKNNKLSFISNPLVQLVGKNGHGKSSIALILEEVLFNKNSKGIKKSDIINRHSKDTQYSIELDFDKDGECYTIKTTRGSSQTVKLYHGDVDISSHTATGTYKLIEQLIGLDHKAFSQIVYQSSASSLEFLTATDTNRKKFLIELLNLSRYTVASDVFKQISSELSKDISVVQAQVNTITSWLDKYSDVDLEVQELLPVPQLDSILLQQQAQLSTQISSLDQTNKKITQNSTYKALQDKIKLVPIPQQPQESTDPLKANIVELRKTSQDAEQFILKMNKLRGTCPTCLQVIDNQKIAELVSEHTKISTSAKEQIEKFSKDLLELEGQIKEWELAVKAQESWEKYHNLIDTTLPEVALDKEVLETELNTLEQSIVQTRQKIKRAEEANAKIQAHNSKVDTIAKQLLEFNEELELHSGKLHELSERMGIINILTKTFSTTGLIAYKIECLVKDLEELTNMYLVDMSDGRFQIGFEVNTSDKLNVVITDNGKDIDILALSSGERARVNVSALLAIRKLMQSLSSSRINLLILDETVETLDVDGKERLIEVLLKEESLNTFIVSHGFSHPLLEKVNVVKHNNISRIES